MVSTIASVASVAIVGEVVQPNHDQLITYNRGTLMGLHLARTGLRKNTMFIV